MSSSRIKILKDEVANAIAAGEVVERPFSVVKELVENSLDAGATEIVIELKFGGQKLISVRDNGIGMNQDDALLAFERHATSKVETMTDIQSVSTLGFRGEALPSIAAVAKVDIITRDESTMAGTMIRIEGGILKKVSEVGSPVGTTVAVRNLFYNLPARKKFLKSIGNEMSHVVNLISGYVLAYPTVTFKLIHNNRDVMSSAGLSSLRDAIRYIYGKEVEENLLETSFSCVLTGLEGGNGFPLMVSGYLTAPSISRPSAKNINVLVNRRPVYSRIVIAAMKEAFHTILPTGRFPVAVMDLRIDPMGVDVNVHPTKQEVRFIDEKGVLEAVRKALTASLTSGSLIQGLNIPAAQKSETTEFHQTMETSGAIAHEYASSECTVTENPGSESEDPDSNDSADTDSYDGSSHNPDISSGSADLKNRQYFSNEHTSASAETASMSRATTQSLPLTGGNSISHGRTAPAPSMGNTLTPMTRVETGLHEQSSNSTIHRHPRIAEAVAVGQVFNTFIVAQNQSEMLLLDQHIVHERIIYEELMRLYFTSDFTAQGLLFPVIIELSQTDVQVMYKNMYILNRLGFSIEAFGGNNFLVKTVPVILGRIEEKETIYEILDSLMTTLYVKKLDDLKESLIIRTACHTAIKAGEPLDLDTMSRLLNKLAMTENPYTCPHGRPIVVSMTASELGKRFKRG
ncbi:MAG: hypothetical protein CVV64_03420 [Candidatus Wallbacteria bacterium HGW-Wallbacteria-1]|uniref:DNA mismatch repair protein MutL n=1 Tax=Candidatus Wallbacteria bacterium HGW-Wallbacteria-1 TaxID=2013854 RepID=A0A2N1PTQ0_9BACT|nr:MAG: hypothetical protein CVV64_03420 [Candidatus Wallbacteria bacterium HGW-Wallbacteria-1]